MNRVWKHFFKNLSWPLGFVSYFIIVSIGASYAEDVFFGGAIVVSVIFFVLPMLVWLVRDMWRDAKQKVEWENEDMMRRIKGD